MSFEMPSRSRRVIFSRLRIAAIDSFAFNSETRACGVLWGCPLPLFFGVVFSLLNSSRLREARAGDICNACVLLVKRWKKLPAGSKKNWNHVRSALPFPPYWDRIEGSVTAGHAVILHRAAFYSRKKERKKERKKKTVLYFVLKVQFQELRKLASARNSVFFRL